MSKPKEPINLGFCPVCKEELGHWKRTVSNVVFCYLCSFNIEEEHSVRQHVAWAKDYKKNMMPKSTQK